MVFTPKKGYSARRASTVFTDGTNDQRADFTRELDSDWIIEKYSADQSSLILTNGNDKQRATVVYNIGNSGGSGSGDVTSVNGKTGAVVLSGIDINSTVGDETNTITTHLQNLTDTTTTIQQNISTLEQNKANVTDLPQNLTGTAGQVYTKTVDGAEWADATPELPQVSTIAEFSSPVAADLNKLVLYVGPTVDADEVSIQKILDNKIINGHVFSVVERTLAISETETETIYMWKDVYENIPTVGDETNNKILSNDGLNIEWIDAPSATEVIMREL